MSKREMNVHDPVEGEDQAYDADYKKFSAILTASEQRLDLIVIA